MHFHILFQNYTLSIGDIAFRIAKNIELYNKKNEISVEDSKRSGIVVSDINEVRLFFMCNVFLNKGLFDQYRPC